MKIRVETLDRGAVVIPEGRLDFGAAAGFQAELERAIAQAGGAAVLVDCAALDYVSSAGLRALLVAVKAAQRVRCSFALYALRPAVREVFDLSGFGKIIAVFPDRATALGAAAPTPP